MVPTEGSGVKNPAAISWQDKAGRTWSDLYLETDRQLEPLGTIALERLAPRPGERVLDVGCGCGQTLLQLARAVGPAGRVLGVDVSEEMLGRARARVADAAPGAEVAIVCGDAAAHPFPDGAFDAIYSRFGVMFFDDPPAAFAHLRAALAPGGRLAFVSWQAQEHNPWSLVPLRAVQAALTDVPPLPMLAPGAPGPFSLADAEQLRALLAGAGFRDVVAEPVKVEIRVAATIGEAVAYLRQIGPAARQLAEVPPERRPVGEQAIARAIAPYASERGVIMQGAILIVTAARKG